MYVIDDVMQHSGADRETATKAVEAVARSVEADSPEVAQRLRDEIAREAVSPDQEPLFDLPTA